MSISHRQLLAFRMLCQSNTFAEAAEKMHLTQPALSTAIKNLETELGGALFSRSTRKVTLSPEGREFLPVALRLLNDWDEALGDMQNLFAMHKGKLAIAAMPSFASSQLPEILGRFHQHWPNITIAVQDVVMESVIAAVMAGRAEIGFTFENEQLEGLEFFPMFTDQFIAVLPESHALSEYSILSWQQLAAYPFIAMNRGSAIRRWIEDHIIRSTLSLDIVIEAGQLATLGQLVKSGLGVSVVPGLCKQQMLDKGLVCRPISDSGLQKRVGMLKSSRVNLSVAAQTLWDMVTSRTE
jgi:LysR family transcriptional regulator, carnitine catabolism transcriptional activator